MILLGAVAIIIGAASWVQWYLRASVRGLQSPPVSVQEIVDINSSEANLQVDRSSSVVPETTAATLVVSDLADAAAIASQSEVVSMLEEIKLALSQQNDAYLYFDDRLLPITETLPKLESAIIMQSSVAQRLEVQILELETQVSQLAAKITESRKPSESSDQTPPFRLIAIDRWNNEWNAVIELDGKIAMIGPQSTRAGWLLLKVDPSSRSALFQAASGKEVQLQVSG